MASALPINVVDLLHARGVESARIEFKKGWNEGPTAQQVVKTLCAFANDFYEVNGGYVVLGVESVDGRAVLPPAGLEPEKLELIQKEIRGQCQRIDPEYHPIMSTEVVDGRHILVLYAPASDVRPHRVAAEGKERHYYVRLGAETVDAEKANVLPELIARTARVPFDDRRNTRFGLHDLRSTLVREYLSEVRSGLLDEPDDLEIYRRMKLSARVNGHEVPRNVALLFFSDDPEKAFPGARIEVVQFAAGGDVLQERIFRGPLARQVRDCLDHLRNLSTSLVRKHPDKAEAEGWVSYPFAAIEEAVVNAVYHRSYDGVGEPTKVYLYPDRIEVTSYPGPVPGIEAANFLPGGRIPNVPARNRRIGELLKELRLAEARGTGIRKIQRSMKENASPVPEFRFDEGRTYFTVVLPAHPEYVVLNALAEASYLEATGDVKGAIARLEAAMAEMPSDRLGAKLVKLLVAAGERGRAVGVVRTILESGGHRVPHRTIVALGPENLPDDVRAELLALLGPARKAAESLAAARKYFEAGAFQESHREYEKVGETLFDFPVEVVTFASTKLRLASTLLDSDEEASGPTVDRLLREAIELNRRAADASPEHHEAVAEQNRQIDEVLARRRGRPS